MNADEKRKRKEIIKLEKQMQRSPSAVTVMSLAEKYVEVGESHQAVAVLMEGMEEFPQYETSAGLVCEVHDHVSDARSLHSRGDDQIGIDESSRQCHGSATDAADSCMC